MSNLAYPKPSTFPDLVTKHWVLEASAGTGKTYTLEHIVVDLVLAGDHPLQEIVIVTYTEAASLELRRRIREKLEELRDLPEDKTQTGRDHWVIDDSARAKLGAALQAFDRTVISTIHAFCQKILQDAAFETGQLFRQQRVDEFELFVETFKDHLRTTFCAPEGAEAFLVEALAWAGSPEDLLKLLRNAWSARATLLPAETSIEEAREAIRAFPVAELRDAAALERDLGKKSIRHILPRFEALATLLELLQTSDSPKAWDTLIASEVLAGATSVWGTAVWEQELPAGPALRVREGLQRLKSCLPTVDALIVHRLLPPITQDIKARKASEGLFDFNDMITQVADGMQNPSLVKRLQERYKVGLIDEFQDTDARQWEIFHTLFGGPEHRLVLVGDPKQAIYDFRGGDLPTYLQARDEIMDGGGQSLALDVNYRSSAALVGAVNELLEAEGGFFTPPNAYPAPVSAGKAPRLLRATGAELPPLQLIMVPVSEKVGRIRSQLAAGVASAFRKLIDEGVLLDAGTDAPVRSLHPGDLMVLTYTTKESIQMAKALRRAGLPSMFFKADGLFQTREALELKDLLGAVLRPDDPEARGRALLTRFFGFSLAEAEACLDLLPDHAVLTRLEAWQDLAHQRRFPRFFNTVMEESGIARRLLLTEQGDRALTNLQHIIEHLLAEATASHPDLEDLVLRLGRWIREEDTPAENDNPGIQRAEGQAKAVRILTIHKAKGLEAPVVALFGGYSIRPEQNGEGHRFHGPGNERSLFLGNTSAMPSDMQTRVTEEANQEEERKLYVAVTRPKVQLLLPVFEPGPEAPDPKGSFDDEGHPKGPYGFLNRRLRTLLEERSETWASWATPLPSGMATPVPAEVVSVPLSLTLPPDQPRPDFEQLARRGRPLWIYSYTSLSQAFGESSRSFSHEDDARAADEVEAPKVRRPAGALPGSAAMGSALHELLEKLPQGSTKAASPAAWKTTHLPLAESCLLNQGLDPYLAGEALQLARLALTTPVELPEGPTVVLDDLATRLVEVGFQMPFPGHPDALEGFIDLLFEWQGRIYILDWKSNTLDDGDYGTAALAQHMAAHYDLQVRIYTLVALKLAGISTEAEFLARFGGAVYVYLRGLPTGGIWTGRPSWDEVEGWRQDLIALGIDDLAIVRMERGMHG